MWNVRCCMACALLGLLCSECPDLRRNAVHRQRLEVHRLVAEPVAGAVPEAVLEPLRGVAAQRGGRGGGGGGAVGCFWGVVGGGGGGWGTRRLAAASRRGCRRPGSASRSRRWIGRVGSAARACARRHSRAGVCAPAGAG